MGNRSRYFRMSGPAVFLCIVAVCMAGCWEEIEYTSPDATTVAQRQTPPPVNADPPAAAIGTTDSGAGLSDADEGVQGADANDFPSDELYETEPTELAIADIEEPTTAATSEAMPPTQSLATRHAAWQLGSKLSLTALAHDRGIAPDKVADWFAECRSLAESLGTSVAELPEPAEEAASDGASRQALNYLFVQAQEIGRDLSGRHGPEHVALFEVAVKSNLLQVLYEPGSSATEAISTAIAEAAPRARLPAELWRPMLDTLANQSPAADVRAAVRKMHADVEQYLAEEVE